MGKVHIKFNKKSLTAFTVSSLVQDACTDIGDTTFDTTLYHNGNNVYPIEGDTIYVNTTFSLLTTSDHFMSNNQFLRVNQGISIPIICD